MSISRRGKRRIVIAGREFLWWIRENDWGDALRVMLPDGSFHVELQRGQIDPDHSHVTIHATTGGLIPSGRFRCPVFETVAVTPRTVRALLEWVFDASTVWLPVDYRGQAQPPPSTPAEDRGTRL
jgi:hypothetical protein